MTLIKSKDVIGYSHHNINDAIQHALSQAGDYVRFKIIETRGSIIKENHRQYEVTLTAFIE